MSRPGSVEEELKELFEREMRCLREEGAAFGRARPDIAGFLDPDVPTPPDPTVDRMVEGFALLVARLRQAVSREEAVVPASLLERLEDGLGDPLPSATMVQATLRAGATDPLRLGRGELLRTGTDPLRGFRFALAQDLVVHPLEVRDAGVEAGDAGHSRLRLELRSTAGPISWPDPLLLHLDGDAAAAWTLRHALVRRARSVLARGDQGPWREGRVRIRAAQGGGLHGDPHAHPLLELRDLFRCGERFRFVAFEGIGRSFGKTESVSIRVDLDGEYPREAARAVSAVSLRPNVAPAANRWIGTAGAVREAGRMETILHPPEGTRVVRVRALSGAPAGEGGGKVRFRRLGDRDRGDRHRVPFHCARVAPASDGSDRVLVSVGRPAGVREPRAEALVATMDLCDGIRPHSRPFSPPMTAVDPGVRAAAEFVSLGRPTAPFRIGGGIGERGRLLALAALRWRGPWDVQTLRTVLGILLDGSSDPSRTLVDALGEVRRSVGFAGVPGRPVVQAEFLLVDPSCFAGDWGRLGLLDAFVALLGRLVREDVPLGWECRCLARVDPCGASLVHEEQRAPDGGQPGADRSPGECAR